MKPTVSSYAHPLRVIAVLFFIAALLAGCAGQVAVPTATVAPTVPPTVAVVASATPVAPTAAPAATPTAEITLEPTAPALVFGPELYGQSIKDLPYCSTPGGDDLLMDVYYPEQGEPPFPVVVFVHGGSWVEGDKWNVSEVLEPTGLVTGGNMMISIQYRLAPRDPFPSMIEDVKCAVRSIRANHEAYAADPERIALMGTSSGGHLVALAGVAGPEAGWDVGDYPDESSRPNAIVDFYGPIDLAHITLGGGSVIRRAFGVDDLNDPVLETYTPLAYITPDDAPFLIVHGIDDPTVPISHSEVLAADLEAAGVPVTLLKVARLGHRIPYNDRSDPTYAGYMQALRAFLDETIGR